MSDFTEEQLSNGHWLFSGPCDFIAGAAKIEQIPANNLPEVAFCGLSNVGKSSLINALTGRKTLARVSHTPGRTQQINFFRLREHLTLVDLPGYGYAKTSKKNLHAWSQLIQTYLKGRPNLLRTFILIDSRRCVKDTDLAIMKMLDDAAQSYQIILTKSDELTESQRNEALAVVKQQTKGCIALFPELIMTSSKKGTNIDEFRATIAKIV